MGDLIHEAFSHKNENKHKEKQYIAEETINDDGTININLPVDEMLIDYLLTVLKNYIAYIHMPKRLYWPDLEEDINIHKKLLLSCGIITDSDEVTDSWDGEYDSDVLSEYEDYSNAHLLDMFDLDNSCRIKSSFKKGLDWLVKFEDKWDLDNKNLSFTEIRDISKRIKKR